MFYKIYVDRFILFCYYDINEFSYISDLFNAIGRDYDDFYNVTYRYYDLKLEDNI